MSLIRLNEQYKKVLTKKEVNLLLNNSKQILNPNTIQYLQKIVSLSDSILNPNLIDENTINILKQFLFYNDITIYNIYNQSLKLFKKNNYNLTIISNPEKLEGIVVKASYNDNTFNIFNFDYHNNIPIIKIFETIIDDKLKNQQISTLYNKLEILKRQYIDYDKTLSNNKYFQSNDLYFIEQCNKEIEFLKEKNNPTSTILYQSQLQAYYSNLLLSTYGLNDNKYFTENIKIKHDYYNNSILIKTLTKTYPHATIIRTINYY